MIEPTNENNTSPYFSIVIPAHNEEDHIGSCLQSIFNADYDSSQYEVIVVDNGSQDRTYDITLSFENVKVFQLIEGNVGAVRNYGATQTSGDILVFLDADCLIDNDWLNRAKRLIEDRPNCAYGGGARLPCNATWIEESWLLQNKGQPTLPKHLIGASTMIQKEFFLEVGGFDEQISSGEDTDLHNRLVSKNTFVLIDHALDVTHLGNAKNLYHFIKRQVWHSENYLTNLKVSLKDPTFYVTLTFICFFLLFIIQSFCSPDYIAIISNLFLLTIIPALLSFKRMYRANYFTLNPNNLFKIYFLDLLYLIGRSIGILIGVLKNPIKIP